ncbi:MAG: lipid-A-disaccharide synthase [Thermodesulfobacteriota bacterium]|nr:lipid-A-disaccharide synthase [Thermodesulfobacteriota bacterium]
MNTETPVADTRCVMIVAGEASGDLHGANLIRRTRERCDGVFFFGIGGAEMRNAGARILVEASELSVVGITEIFIRLPSILKGMGAAKRALSSGLPDLLILIDFPDFNLRLAATARKHGVPVFYYITPQVWAWRKRRVYQIRQRVDHAAVILPFEVDFFRQYDVPVTFVGHPLLDAGYEVLPEPVADNEETVVGLLPGSRHGEILRHLPVMLDAAAAMAEKDPKIRFLVSSAACIDPAFVRSITDKYGERVALEVVPGNVVNVFRQSALVIAVSGTVAVEAALYTTPLIVIYRVSWISYWLARILVKIDHISLVNLVAEDRLVPELIQSDATADKIAQTALGLLGDENRLMAIKTGLRKVRERLGGPGASDRAAEIAVGMLTAS